MGGADFDRLLTEIQEANRASLRYSRTRLLGTWAAVALLAILTCIALLLSIGTARNQRNLIKQTAEGAEETADTAHAQTVKNTEQITVVQKEVTVLGEQVASVEDVLAAEGLIPPPPGEQGEQGDQGVAGEGGTAGTTGLVGEPGPPGSPGVAGLPGATGVQGAPGSPGEQGVQGEQGERGEAGERGARGRKGERGQPGEAGSDGAQGVAGADGATGAQGEQGIQGPQGEQGIPGPPGPPGEPGPQGIPGVSCPNTITVDVPGTGDVTVCTP